ncbi:hypothetical protein GCM10020258_38740 [Sphingomonas yabuuchiae]
MTPDERPNATDAAELASIEVEVPMAIAFALAPNVAESPIPTVEMPAALVPAPIAVERTPDATAPLTADGVAAPP